MRLGKKQISAILALVVVVIASAVSVFNKQKEESKPIDNTYSNADNLIVHFLDVGQGDSEFIELPGGRCMLIDAGTQEYSQTVIESIKSCGYSSIDYVIATHPHADHIGGMSDVIESFDVGEIYMPKVLTSTRTFENLLNAISDKGLTINTAKAGVEVYSDSVLKMEFLAPVGGSYDDLNNSSAVLKISCGSNSFLFMGDAEGLSEKEMLSRDYGLLNADVLKVGHHGSDSSSTSDFLDAVSPRYAVISCGVDNPYGHPHHETIDSLNKIGAEIYRTDEQGTVTITCNASGELNVETEGK